MSWLSKNTQDILLNEENVLDAVQFEQCFIEFKNAHNRQLMFQYVIAAFCFIGGLLALSFGFGVAGVGLLVAALYFNLNSIHHSLIADHLDMARMLSMRINTLNKQIEMLLLAQKKDAT
jgi:hypothetical protein